MITAFRAATKVCSVIAAFASCLAAAPSYAGSNTIAYVSSTGSGTACTAALPCGSLVAAFGSLASETGVIVCVDPLASGPENVGIAASVDAQVSCPGAVELLNDSFMLMQTSKIKIRGLTFAVVGAFNGTDPGFYVLGGGTVVLEDCAFDKMPNLALDIEPNGPLNLVIKNSRISNSASGILLKPRAGGSIHATFDHVTVSQNTGGGIKIDTTNGPVTTDITGSVVSDNGGNGINALGNAGGQNVVSIKDSVIAKNGVAGVQANGANAGILVATTLLDQNAGGATSIVGGGNLFTYGNNQIVGSAGAGFNHTAGVQ
jgi:hypothetical protein